MKISEIITKLQLKVLSGQDSLEGEVTGGYASDLLSDVIANSKEGNLWNITAVAKLKDLAGIIIINNREPDEETLKKAQEENVPIFCSDEMAFEISGKLYNLIKQQE